MGLPYVGCMYVLVLRVLPGTKMPSMALLGHRTIMSEYIFLTWLIWLQ